MKRGGVRIGAGNLRGKHIKVPAGHAVRPMRARLREALFGILGEHTIGARWLDVFAGSGAVAFEALSRGAHEATLLENSREVLEVLRGNIADLALKHQARILEVDAYEYQPETGRAFDVIFLDPPFPDYSARPNPWQLAERLAGSNTLVPGGIIGLEHPARVSPPDLGPAVEIWKQRRYGDTALALWAKAPQVVPED